MLPFMRFSPPHYDQFPLPWVGFGLFIIVIVTRLGTPLIINKLENGIYFKKLGLILPGCLMTLLVLHDLEVLDWKTGGGIAECITLIFVLVVHLWRRSLFLSMGLPFFLYLALQRL